jgi:hypothetical protein
MQNWSMIVIHDPTEHYILQEYCYFCKQLPHYLSEDSATYYGCLTMVTRQSALSDNIYTDPACPKCADKWLSPITEDRRLGPQDMRRVEKDLRRLNGGG